MAEGLANTEIVEGLVAGDSKAILDLLQMVAPEWAEVTVGELQKDLLTGGYSGAALYKISSLSKKSSKTVLSIRCVKTINIPVNINDVIIEIQKKPVLLSKI